MSVTAIHEAPATAHADTATEFGAAVAAAKQQSQTQQVPWSTITSDAVQAMAPFLMLQFQSILGLASGGEQD
jgi:hypothetical protein